MFDDYFGKLTRISTGAYPWQRDLFERFVHGQFPPSLNLPTGLGKTSVMPVWLLALAAAPGIVPRRLVWVVDRRVVVDQATAEAEALAEALQALPDGDELRSRLESLSIAGGEDDTLAVSTLRGQRANNRAWSIDPSRPAIIVGTVDMVGSRLLFSGYGDGRWHAPQHAGLLGQDCLLINDEAHLTPAFAKLLDEVQACIARQGSFKPFRAIRVSATQSDSDRYPASLDTDLHASSEFARRYNASKQLRLHPAADKKAFEKIMVDLATGDAAGRTLVFVQKPETAVKLRDLIVKRTGSTRIRLLTGTQRGFERDQLVADEVFREFAGRVVSGTPCWLVATSAGEVGVNISSDRLVTEHDTADHLLQRFGRLNRFGETQGAAHLVYPQGDDKDEAKRETMGYLRSLPSPAANLHDVSPRSLFENPPPVQAFAPAPPLARLEEWLLDVWSQTTLGACEARPQVAPWLHGKPEPELPTTEVAWRWDVEWLTKPGVAIEDIDEALECHRVRARERLREPTFRLRKKLEQLDGSTPILCVASDGTVRQTTLGDPGQIEYALLLLPVGCGAIVDGMFSPGEVSSSPYDVADEGVEPRRARSLAPLEDSGLRLSWQITVEPDENSDTEPVTVYYYSTPRERGVSIGRDVYLDDHLRDVAETARLLALKLGLDEELVRALERTGTLHDLGKAEPIWQHAMRGDVEHPLAKTARRGRPALLDGFRHELASIERAGEAGDLALHLIAAHHGWGRPHFRRQAFNRRALKASEEIPLEAARRFARLTARYGHWGLAYLEAVFKAADSIASSKAEEQPADA
ncbi:MAG: type I-U CRISPR-associated helicase/endonuclease Cas3 [Acidobacteriales bacterium]|nr:type I-U CRISPR-associated helicase/endonuclease Cas3 [Terriglobales bacterium]